MRSLAIRGGGLGDLILTIPSFLALEKISKELYISVPYQWFPLFEGFCQLIPLEGKLINSLWLDGKGFIDALGIFDLAITWHWDKEGLFLKNLRKVAKKVVKCEISPTNVHQSINLFKPLFEIDRRIKFPDFIRLPNLPFWEKHKTHDISIHPGSGGSEKVWPVENYLFLIEELKKETYRIKVFLGEAEGESLFSVFSKIQGIELKQNLPLKVLINELLKSALYLGNDSGISHLSAILGVPTVVIFKATNPYIWSPRGERVHVLSTYPEKEWIKKEIVLDLVKKILV